MPYLGEIAALITSLSFAFTATFFTFGGRLVGSEIVNRTRLLFGLALLLFSHRLFLGTLFPFGVDGQRWLWLGLSGVIGLSLGDAFLFQAFLWIGPRLAMLLMSLAPVLAALLAWVFLGETLNIGQMTGILLTIGGVVWVILERNQHAPSENPSPPRPHFGIGILFGLGAATGQALGLLLSKLGLYGGFSALSGNLIRMSAAAAAIWLYTLLRGQAGNTLRQLTQRPQSLPYILGGAVFGPLIGVSLSLLAVQRTEVGIASTLIALTPIFMLPIGALVFKERFGWQAVAGTLLAILGVGLLFLS